MRSWTTVKSLLAKDFLKSTKSDRQLSETDFDSIHSLLGDEISWEAFSNFLPWFQAFKYLILKIQAEWSQIQPKLIYGIISRDVAASLLAASPPGTFLIRFSNTQQGAIALAYVAANKKVRNSLITLNSTGKFQTDVEEVENTDYNAATSLSELIMHLKPLTTLYPKFAKSNAFRDVEDGPR